MSRPITELEAAQAIGEVGMMVKVEVMGCDDFTSFEIEATEVELAFLEKVCAASVKASKYGCQPTIEIEEKK